MDYMNNKTRWVVKINDQKTKRVLIEYFPLENKFVFTGQLKIAEIWYDLSKREIILGKEVIGYAELDKPIYKFTTVEDIDIDDNILKVYTELEDKISIYISFTEMMKEYSNIKIGYEGDEVNNKE